MKSHTTYCLQIPDYPQTRQFAQTVSFSFSLRFPIGTLNLHSRSTAHVFAVPLTTHLTPILQIIFAIGVILGQVVLLISKYILS